jgi:hypothetical protein
MHSGPREQNGIAEVDSDMVVDDRELPIYSVNLGEKRQTRNNVASFKQHTSSVQIEIRKKAVGSGQREHQYK